VFDPAVRLRQFLGPRAACSASDFWYDRQPGQT
jgi:hypothetical protein